MDVMECSSNSFPTCNYMPTTMIDKYLSSGGEEDVDLDFLAPHLQRTLDSPDWVYPTTGWYFDETDGSGGMPSAVPILYQEPFREGDPDDENLTYNHFFKDKNCAFKLQDSNYGAAGWFFHHAHFLASMNSVGYSTLAEELSQMETTVFTGIEDSTYGIDDCE
jgi:hypothetical protein